MWPVILVFHKMIYTHTHTHTHTHSHIMALIQSCTCRSRLMALKHMGIVENYEHVHTNLQTCKPVDGGCGGAGRGVIPEMLSRCTWH